jgi:hypothetical protein
MEVGLRRLCSDARGMPWSAAGGLVGLQAIMHLFMQEAWLRMLFKKRV